MTRLRAGDILSWSIEGDGARWIGRSCGEVVSASGPAALWQGIAAKSDGAPVHLTGGGAVADRAALARAARLIEAGRDAVIGRVGYRSGRRSRATGRIATIRYLNTPPGAILVRSDALDKAAEWAGARSFDEFWPFDLANALHRAGWLGASDLDFARCDGDAPGGAMERVPFARANPSPSPGETAPLILVYGQPDASTSLYFEALPDDLAARVRFLSPGDIFSDLPWLASASLVIVVRGFEQMVLSGCAALLGEIGVPYAWFIDDDFIALREEESAFRFYTSERIKAFLGSAAAVIATTRALLDTFAPFAPAGLLWPCLYDRPLAKSAPSAATALCVGSFGGAFRRESFTRHVLPALAALRDDAPATVYAANGLAHDVSRREAAPVLFEPEFRSFVHQWRRMDIQAVVHPHGDTANIANKSMASLLVAAYLGAVPITGDEPAYAAAGENEGVLKAGPSAEDWLACLRRLADRAEREQLFARLDCFCRTAFHPERAREPFEALLLRAAPGGAVNAARRIQRACQSPVLRRALAEQPARGRSLAQRLRRSAAKRWSRWRGPAPRR